MRSAPQGLVAALKSNRALAAACNAVGVAIMAERDTLLTEILDGNVVAFERLRPAGSHLTLADAQQLVVDTIERMEQATYGHLAVADVLLRVACERASAERPVRVLEVASRNGWLLCNLARRARSREIAIALTGSDLNAELVASMQQRFLEGQVPATALVANACDLAGVPDGAYHAAFMTFSLHHFPEADGPHALRELDRVSDGGMMIVDSTRRFLALAAVPTLAVLLAPHGGRRFARHDAAATVRRSYTADELRRLVKDAGLSDCYRVGPLPTRHPERLIANAIWPTSSPR